MSAPPQFPLDIVPAGDRPEDLGTLHQERQLELDRAERRRRWQDRLAGAQPSTPGESENPTPQLQDPSTPSLPEGEGVSAGDVAQDVGRGLVGAPREITGGVFDALKETAQFVQEFQGTQGMTAAAAEQLPDIEGTGTATGGLIRGVSQFLTGFAGAGKLKPLQALAKMGKAGAIANPALRGALADFTVFDPDEERLSNLVQEFPALANPVNEYLAADPEDSDLEGRFKQSIEGLGLGAATDGFVRGVRALRSMRAAKTAAGLDDAATVQAIQTADAQRGLMIELVGDPEAKAVEVRPRADAPDEAGEVFVNWARISQPDDVKAMIQELADARAGNIDTARRGVRTWQATRISAEQRNAWELLAERKVGQPFNAEETVAVRELWVRSGARTKELAQLVATEGSDLSRVALRRQLAVHNAIQEQVIAARTETARALNAWRIQVGDAVDFAGQMDQLRALAQSDRDIDEIAQSVLQLAGAGLEKELDAFVLGAGAAKGVNVIRQVYYAAMLSSPHTHMRNLIGNSTAMPLQMLERRVAAWTGQLFGQQNVPDGEAMAQLFGMTQGFQRAFRFGAKQRQVFASARAQIASDPDAARQLLRDSDVGTFWQSALTGETGIGMGRPEVPRGGAFAASGQHIAQRIIARTGIDVSSPIGRVAAFLDTVTTAPMRALSASDEVFKTITYDMELNAQAFRRATQEMNAGQLPREQFEERVTELLTNPDEYARMSAAKFAETSTFTQRPGEFGQAAAELANKVPILGRIVLPFRSTPFNIASFGFRRTPLAPFVGQWRADIAAGGARADIAWSQFLVGNAVLAAMADFALAGRITGIGPEDPAERANLMRQGWQPNSWQVGDRYFSYRGLEPLATSLNLAANTVDILKYQDWEDDDAALDELVIATTMAISQQATSQQYMSGVSAFFETMSDPQRYGENWFQRLATAPIPRALALGTQTLDPTVRMATDIGDAIRAQTPGLSKGLPPARDVWGRPIRRESGLGKAYDFFSPIHSRSGKDAQPIDAELQRLEHYVGMPAKKVSFGGESISLRNRPDVYSRYVALAGNELKLPIFGREKVGLMDALNALVSGKTPQSRVYERLSDGADGDKGRMIDEIVDAYRDAAREQLLEEFPDLRARVERSIDERREQQRLTLRQSQ